MSGNIFENLKQKVYCYFCERETTKHAYILCRECQNLSICLVCFCSQIEKNGHKKTHCYSTIPNFEFSLKNNSWTAIQELLFVEGIEKFGFGNWTEISDFIGQKTAEETELHFFENDFLQKSCFISAFSTNNYKKKPKFDNRANYSISNGKEVKSLTNPVQKSIVHTENKVEKKKILDSKKFSRNNESNSPESEKNESKSSQLMLRNLHYEAFENCPIKLFDFKSLLARKLDQLSKSLEIANNRTIKEKNQHELLSSIFGYKPFRTEFEVEFNNEAELYLADMEFKPEDSPEEINAKFRVLELYQAKLDERIKRKDFVIDNNFLNLNEFLENEKIMSNNEKVFREIAKPEMLSESKDAIDDMIQCYLNKIKFEKHKNHLFCQKKGDDSKWNKLLQDQTIDRSSGDHKFNGSRVESLIFDKKEGMSSNSLNANRSLARIFDEELAFCNKNLIDMDTYLIIKEYLIRKSCFIGALDKVKILEGSLFEKRIFLLAFDFLLDMGLIVKNVQTDEEIRVQEETF